MPSKYAAEIVTLQGCGHWNEDHAVTHELDDQVVAVACDGVSPLMRPTSSTESGGYQASHLATSVLAQDAMARWPDIIVRANRRIRGAMIRAYINPDDPTQRWGTTFLGTRVLPHALSWVFAGDGAIVIVYRDGRHKLLNTFPDFDVPTLTEWKRLTELGIPREERRKRVSHLIADVRSQANKTYAILNGDPAMGPCLQFGVEEFPDDDVHSVVLLTDGAFWPTDDPLKENVGLWVAYYLKHGLKATLAHVRRLYEEDVAITRFLRVKHYDDATGVAITFHH